MKKLLSLLSVLTISGSAVPTTIAASSYEKEENKLKNNKINYLQNNNLEALSRNKRQNNQNNIFEIIKYIGNINLKNDSLGENGIILNNKLYFGSSKEVYSTDGADKGSIYEYNLETNQQKIIITTENRYTSVYGLNNKLYFGSYSGSIYEWDPTTNQQKIIFTEKNCSIPHTFCRLQENKKK